MTRRQDILARLLNRGVVEGDTIRVSLNIGGGDHTGGGICDVPVIAADTMTPWMHADAALRDEAVRRLAEALDVPLELIATPFYPPAPIERELDPRAMYEIARYGGIVGDRLHPGRYDLPDGCRWSDAGMFVYPGAPEPEGTIVWQAWVSPLELDRMKVTPLERFRWENRHARYEIEREGYMPGPMHAYRMDGGAILLEWEGRLG